MCTIVQEREDPNGFSYVKRSVYDQGYTALNPDRDIYHERVYYKKDHLGSIRGVYFISDGEPRWQYRPYAYDAYGNIIEDPGAPKSSFDRHFTGHFFHRPTGLYLAPYRAYDSKTGRWLSREPLGLDGPNLYHYVFNDPVNYVDPDGLAGLRFSDFAPYVQVGLTVGLGVACGPVCGALAVGIGIVQLGVALYPPVRYPSAAGFIGAGGDIAGGVFGAVGGSAGTACRVNFKK